MIRVSTPGRPASHWRTGLSRRRTRNKWHHDSDVALTGSDWHWLAAGRWRPAGGPRRGRGRVTDDGQGRLRARARRAAGRPPARLGRVAAAPRLARRGGHGQSESVSQTRSWVALRATRRGQRQPEARGTVTPSRRWASVRQSGPQAVRLEGVTVTPTPSGWREARRAGVRVGWTGPQAASGILTPWTKPLENVRTSTY